MTYDTWKATNSDDEWLGPDPNEPSGRDQIIDELDQLENSAKGQMDENARRHRITALYKMLQDAL
jgi:hypothetical protein